MNGNRPILRALAVATDHISEDEEVGSGNLFIHEDQPVDAQMSEGEEEVVVVCDTVSSDDYDSPGDDWSVTRPITLSKKLKREAVSQFLTLCHTIYL